MLSSRPVQKPSCWSRRLGFALLLAATLGARAAPDSIPPAATDAGAGASVERASGRPIDAAGIVQSVRDSASDLVMAAMNFLGVPYRRGGSSAESGFDCSGFTRYVFEHSVGLVLPRRADEQARWAGLFKIDREELKPGDLVFFRTMRRTFSHVGIYIGDDKFVHAPRPGGDVRVDDLRKSYWARRFTGARRVDPSALTLAASPTLQ